MAFECGCCTRTFFSEESRRVHRNKEHAQFTGLATGKCALCRHEFATFFAFYDHFTQNHASSLQAAVTRAETKLRSQVEAPARLILPAFPANGSNFWWIWDYNDDAYFFFLVDEAIEVMEEEAEKALAVAESIALAARVQNVRIAESRRKRRKKRAMASNLAEPATVPVTSMPPTIAPGPTVVATLSVIGEYSGFGVGATDPSACATVDPASTVREEPKQQSRAQLNEMMLRMRARMQAAFAAEDAAAATARQAASKGAGEITASDTSASQPLAVAAAGLAAKRAGDAEGEEVAAKKPKRSKLRTGEESAIPLHLRKPKPEDDDEVPKAAPLVDLTSQQVPSAPVPAPPVVITIPDLVNTPTQPTEEPIEIDEEVPAPVMPLPIEISSIRTTVVPDPVAQRPVGLPSLHDQLLQRQYQPVRADQRAAAADQRKRLLPVETSDNARTREEAAPTLPTQAVIGTTENTGKDAVVTPKKPEKSAYRTGVDSAIPHFLVPKQEQDDDDCVIIFNLVPNTSPTEGEIFVDEVATHADSIPITVQSATTTPRIGPIIPVAPIVPHNHQVLTNQPTLSGTGGHSVSVPRPPTYSAALCPSTDQTQSPPRPRSPLVGVPRVALPSVSPIAVPHQRTVHSHAVSQGGAAQQQRAPRQRRRNPDPDVAFWNNNAGTDTCPQCRKDVKGSRQVKWAHYLMHHYNLFYAKAQLPGPEDLKNLDRILGGVLGPERGGNRDCLRCSTSHVRQFRSRIELLDHLRTAHSAAFAAFHQEYIRVKSECHSLPKNSAKELEYKRIDDIINDSPETSTALADPVPNSRTSMDGSE